MTRDEAKKQMRVELERDLTSDQRQSDKINIDGKFYTPNELMVEVENNTELGELLVDEFIQFNTPVELTDQERAQIMTLMQQDLDNAPPGWSDNEKFVIDHIGTKMTPNQLFQEVKDGTDFGNRYAQDWLVRHQVSVMMMEAEQNTSLVAKQIGSILKSMQTDERSGGGRSN